MLSQILKLLGLINSFRSMLAILVPLFTLYMVYRFLTRKNQKKAKNGRRNEFIWLFYGKNSLNEKEKVSFWYITLTLLFYLIIHNLNLQNLILESTLKLFFLSFIISLLARIFVGEKYEQ